MPSRALRATALALLLALAGGPAAAQDAATRGTREAEAEARLTAVRARIADITAERQRLDTDRSGAQAAVREADAQVAAALRALRDTDAALAEGEARLAALETERTALADTLSAQRETLARLLRAAYSAGRHANLKLLLAQDRVQDLSRALAYQHFLQRDRVRRIDALLAELSRLQALADDIAAQRAALQATREAQLAQQATLDAERSARAARVAELDGALQARRDELRSLGRDEQSLLNLLQQLRDIFADIPKRHDDSRAFDTRRGSLPWPLQGRVLSAFGGTLPDGRASKGWLIAAEPGAEVKAVARGRVAFAEWMNGFGLILILDHGDGYMSLYAHNDALLREAGDWVAAGEPVASAGASGGQNQAGLYFELRHRGQAIDPRRWLRPR